MNTRTKTWGKTPYMMFYSGVKPVTLILAVLLYFTGPGCALLAQEQPYRVVATVDNPVPYVGQQVVYTVKFYATILPVYDYQSPDFTGWWRGEQLTSQGVESLDGVQYQVVTIETLLYPLQSGVLKIASAGIVIPATVFADRSELMTQPVILEAQPLPAGAPADFQGAVGQYDIEITVEPLTLTLGEPVTLRYRVTGSGNLAQISRPALPLSDEIWRAYPNPSTTSLQSRGFGERSFEWRLVAERAGSQAIPAMTFSYFDPDSATYETVVSTSFTIEVLATADGQRELPTTQLTRRHNGSPALVIKSVDILQPESGLETGSLIFWLLPPIAAAGLWSGRAWQRRRKIHRAQIRRTQALKTAKNHLMAARKSEAETAYGQIYDTLLRYFADKVNFERDLMSETELRALPDQDAGLQNRINELQSVLDYLRMAEDGRYAPPGIISVDALVIQTADALNTLDKVWWT